MASRSAGNWLLLILIVLNFLAFGGIIHVWWGQEKSADPRQSPKLTETPVSPIVRNQQGLENFRIVSAKNLFSPDRTGPNQAAAAPLKQGNLEGKLLLGTIIIGSHRIALIGGGSPKNPQGNVESVRQGEELDGFQVVEIKRDAVIFKGRDGLATLHFPE